MDPEKAEASDCKTTLPSPIDQLESSRDRPVRYDRHGLPLVPQPSLHKDDPLVLGWITCSWPIPLDTHDE